MHRGNGFKHLNNDSGLQRLYVSVLFSRNIFLAFSTPEFQAVLSNTWNLLKYCDVDISSQYTSFSPVLCSYLELQSCTRPRSFVAVIGLRWISSNDNILISRSEWPRHVRLACWDFGFESRRGHGYFSLVIVVFSAGTGLTTGLSLVQGSHWIWSGAIITLYIYSE
jgi:hypothetical protein